MPIEETRISQECLNQISIHDYSNPFPRDSDWWWIYAHHHTPTDYTRQIIGRNEVSRESLETRLRTLRNTPIIERFTFAWRNRNGTLIEETNHIFNNDEINTTPMSNTEQPYASLRSLLYLCRRLKKEGNALIKNTNALYWQWFTKTLDVLQQKEKEKHPELYKEIPGIYSISIRWQKILNRIGKITGIYLVKNNVNGPINSYWNKQDCKSYYNMYGLVWLHKNIWEDYQNEGFIKWASKEKEWVAKDTLVNLREFNPTNQKYITKTIALINDKYKLYERCKQCDNLWLKKSLKWNKFIDQYCCPECNSKITEQPINQLHNFQTIHSSYHSHGKWQFYSQRLYKGDDKDLPMGVEIEMNLKSGISNEIAPTMWQSSSMAHY